MDILPKNFILSLLVALIIGLTAPAWAFGHDFQEGDLLFQSLNTSQSLAIKMATGSDYTHCGIVFISEGRVFVYEALAQMTMTPVEEWLERSPEVLWLRLKDPKVLTPQVISQMKKAGTDLKDRTYDTLFQWSDEKVYCSELVYKIYQRGAGMELVPLKTFGDYNLGSEAVLDLIEKRYGGELPLAEKAVAPSDLLQSPLLEVVGRIQGQVQ
ncbi:MAG: peptidoglycan peptidase [Deltaproteobacteria bacterium]|jgi:hypothetical protein|nr:peptidoglycan peptidase [Deltaproteobacteria bacterium]